MKQLLACCCLLSPAPPPTPRRPPACAAPSPRSRATCCRSRRATARTCRWRWRRTPRCRLRKIATLAELKDKYVGVTSEEKDGRLVAVEVHALPPQAPAGHMPWDLRPGSGMTNANLAQQARVTGGDEITMKYKDGEKKILVPPGTPVVSFAPGTLRRPEARRDHLRHREDGRRRQVFDRARVGQQGRSEAAAMNRFLALLLLSTSFSIAAQPARIRGVVESFDGKTLVVKDAGSVQVGDKTEIVFTQPIKLADIRPGDFLGVTSTQGRRRQAHRLRGAPLPEAAQSRPPAVRRRAEPDHDQRQRGHGDAGRRRPRADPDLRRRLAEDQRAARTLRSRSWCRASPRSWCPVRG